MLSAEALLYDEWLEKCQEISREELRNGSPVRTPRTFSMSHSPLLLTLVPPDSTFLPPPSSEMRNLPLLSFLFQGYQDPNIEDFFLSLMSLDREIASIMLADLVVHERRNAVERDHLAGTAITLA